jgi:hypothetical protein
VTTVYASWNGSTRLASWRVLGGSRDGPLKAVVTVPKFGFETAIQLQRGYARFEVEALDAGGRVLDTSAPF